VPTQVVAEYIRQCLASENGEPVEGPMYPSSLRPGGTNIVFFVDNTDRHADDGLLRMEGPPRRYQAVESNTRWETTADGGPSEGSTV
jgi:hypothetical protein